MHRYQDGTYHAVFKVNGKTVWRSLHTRIRKVAKQRLEGEIERTEVIASLPNADWSLEVLLQHYECSLDAKAPKTRRTRKSILNRFKATWPHALDIPIVNVTPLMLRMWLSGERNRLRAVSYNEYLRFIRQAFDLGVEARALDVSPAKGLKQLRPESPKRLTPTWEQFNLIVEEIRSNRYSDHSEDTADLIEFMGAMGVGQAEAANLTWDCIDVNRKELHFRREKTKTSFVVALYPQAVSLVERMVRKAVKSVGTSVFKIRDPKRALAAACQRLSFPNFSPRSFRRMFIVRCLERGIDPRLVAQWQGHQDNGALILKVYGRFTNPEYARKMVRLLE